MKIYKIIIKLILRLHTFFYRLSGRFSIKAEGGLHPKHRLMNYHKFFVNNVKPNDTILDIGCGNGALTYDLAGKAKKVIGIDLSKENIKIAKEKFSASNINYIVGNVVKELPDKKFDVVILSNALEHIENRTEFLNRIKTLMHKILIRVPMINRDWITLYKKELGVEWRSDETHYIEYTLESFKDELNQAGLFIQNYNIQFGEIWSIVSMPKVSL